MSAPSVGSGYLASRVESDARKNSIYIKQCFPMAFCERAALAQFHAAFVFESVRRDQNPVKIVLETSRP